MKIKNRLSVPQADYIFTILRIPNDWKPSEPDDVPPGGEELSVDYVASYAEAREDMLRCNQLALKHGLEKWAVVQSGGGCL